jgi:hypothetical protein
MYTVQSVIQLANSQLSYHEGQKGGHWNNIQKYSEQLPGFSWSDGKAWCATFAQWCFWQAGIVVPPGAQSASCAAAVAAYKKAGRFTEYPVTGAQVFYGPGGGSHCGIVIGWDAANEHAIEGNTNADGSAEGDGVYLKLRQRTSAYVYGYGLPYYPHDTASTPDPHWKGKSLAHP